MMRAAILPGALALTACAAGLTVPADACRGGAAPDLTGRNVGEVGFAPGLPHRVLIPGGEAQAAPPGTLLVSVDDKGWITAAACAR